MINDFKDIESFFKELNNSLEMPIAVYTIGGVVLLKRGLKPSTKDIDIIVSSKNEFIELQKILKFIGFTTSIPSKEYKNMNLSKIFQKGDFRIDLFEVEVCGKFSLTDEMKQRSEKVISLSNISVFLCSNEDIFLFKTMTDREGDISDCISIAKNELLDWDVILAELNNQIVLSGKNIWITWVGERFDILVDKKLDIPIISELNKLRIAYYDNYLSTN